MSIVIERILLCDGGKDCPLVCSYSGGDQRHFTTKEIRKNSHGDGWVTVGSKDYCPTCAEKRKKR